ncbi:MAG: hypothetical protein J7K23_04205 [Thermoproteales archaeon]|nr:hypothetical protein [Thermoproteales archaeon]
MLEWIKQAFDLYTSILGPYFYAGIYIAISAVFYMKTKTPIGLTAASVLFGVFSFLMPAPVHIIGFLSLAVGIATLIYWLLKPVG